MPKPAIFLLLIAIFITGCVSKAKRLEREYDAISSQIRGLQEELKTIVNFELSVDEYIEAKLNYDSERREWIGLRTKNAENDLPIGPDVPAKEDDLHEQKRLLKENYSIISEQIEELEEKRNEIVEEQVELE